MSAVLTDRSGKQHQTLTPGARQSRPFDWGNVFSFLGTLPRPDNIPLSIYRRMAETDSTISAGLEFIDLSCLAQMGPYSNPNKKAQAYIDEMWEYCHTPYEQAISETLSALVFGYSVQEKVIRAGSDRLWLDDLPGLKPEFLHFCPNNTPGSPTYGRITGVKQEQDLMTIIPIDRLVMYSHRPQNSDPYGRSRMKSIYMDWVLQQACYQGWGVAMEMYGSPIAVGHVANSTSEEQDGLGNSTTRGKNMLKQLANLKPGTALVVDLVDQVEILQAKLAVGGDHKQAQDHFNKLKMRGLLIPALLLEHTEIGSFALGNKHFELFLRFIQRLAKTIQQVFLRQIYRPLLWANFGPNCPVGSFAEMESDPQDLKLWSEIFFALTQARFLNPRQLDEYNAIRAKFNLQPAKDESEMPADPTGATTPAGSEKPGNPTGDNGQVSGKVAGGTEGTNTGFPSIVPQAPGGPQGRAASGTPTAQLGYAKATGIDINGNEISEWVGPITVYNGGDLA